MVVVGAVPACPWVHRPRLAGDLGRGSARVTEYEACVRACIREWEPFLVLGVTSSIPQQSNIFRALPGTRSSVNCRPHASLWAP
jgi:hypothetical protein